jgi:hypothetical protein
MTKKYQVFISSTLKDLVRERQETIRSVLDLGHIPSGMEIFPAAFNDVPGVGWIHGNAAASEDLLA